MISKENAKLGYGLAIVLLIVGVVCYAAGSPEALSGDEPVRKVFMGVAGNVLFDHQAHTDYEGDCTVCHHHGDNEFTACNTCHLKAVPNQEPEICLNCHPLTEDMKDIHIEHHQLMIDEPETWSCKDCHQLGEGETVPYACSNCHDPADIEGQAKIMKFQKITDAMHDQCIGCHEDYGAGPVSCDACHAQ
jgi:hypothetical protein